MNKYSLREHLQNKLSPFKSTLKATSYDKENQEFLCKDESTPEVYDFDAYVKEHCKHPVPASPDAIHIGSKDLYCIEFKNQHPSDIKKSKMEKKFRDGTGILKSLLQDFPSKDCRYHFCVVMKNQPKPRHMDYRHIKKGSVMFGLIELNQELGRFYDHVMTASLDSYIERFKELQCA